MVATFGRAIWNKTFFQQIFGGVPCLFVRVYPTIVSCLFIYVASQFRFIVKVDAVILYCVSTYSAPTHVPFALNVKTWPTCVERVVGGVSVSGLGVSPGSMSVFVWSECFCVCVRT